MTRFLYKIFGVDNQAGVDILLLINLALLLLVPFSSASAQVFARGALTGGLPTQAAYSTAPVPRNPAFLDARSPTIVTVWIAQMYELPQLGMHGVAARIDLPPVGLGVRLLRFGFDRFTEERVEFSAGWSLSSDGTGPGIGLGFMAVRQSSAKSSPGLSQRLRAGIHLPATDAIRIGITIERAVRSIHPEDSILMGIAVRMSDQISVFSDVYLERNFPASFRNGLEMKITPHVLVRGGFSTQPNSVSIGLSIPISRLSVHLGFNRHEFLGWSSAVETSFRL